MCELHPLRKVPDGGHAVDGDQVQGLLRPGGPEVADQAVQLLPGMVTIKFKVSCQVLRQT